MCQYFNKKGHVYHSETFLSRPLLAWTVDHVEQYRRLYKSLNDLLDLVYIIVQHGQNPGNEIFYCIYRIVSSILKYTMCITWASNGTKIIDAMTLE